MMAFLVVTLNQVTPEYSNLHILCMLFISFLSLVSLSTRGRPHGTLNNVVNCIAGPRSKVLIGLSPSTLWRTKRDSRL
jgi:hypothetical protein